MKRHSIPTLLAMLLITGCPAQPVPEQPLQPGTLPNAPGVVTPGTITPDAFDALDVQATFPAGSLTKLHTSLRTQAAVDLTATELAKLQVRVSGKLVDPADITFGTPTLDDAGQPIIPLTLKHQPKSAQRRIELANPDRSLRLIGSTSGTSAQINVQTTATAMLGDALAAKGKGDQPIPDAAVATLATILTNALVAVIAGDPLATAAVTHAVEVLTSALGSAGALDQAIRSLTTVSGGGGGGGGGGGVTPIISGSAS